MVRAPEPNLQSCAAGPPVRVPPPHARDERRACSGRSTGRWAIEQLHAAVGLDPNLVDRESGRSGAIALGGAEFLDQLIEQIARIGPGKRAVRLNGIGERTAQGRCEGGPLQRMSGPVERPVTEPAQPRWAEYLRRVPALVSEWLQGDQHSPSQRAILAHPDLLRRMDRQRCGREPRSRRASRGAVRMVAATTTGEASVA